MSSDFEEREDELLALRSIFSSEEFVRHEPKCAGEIRVCVELPAGFSVALREGDTLRQYEISFLPPLHLTFELPEDYPSSSPPSFTFNCCWLTHMQRSALETHLVGLYKATGATVVLFSWVQFLREEALSFLGIDSLLELPSEEQNTLNSSKRRPNAALSEPQNNQDTPMARSADDQNRDVSEWRKNGLPLSSLEVRELVLAVGQTPSSSDWSNTDSQEALQSDPSEDEQKQSKPDQSALNAEPSRDNQNAKSAHTKRIYNSVASDTNEEEQNMSNSSNQTEEKHNLSPPLPLPSTSSVPSGQSEQAGAGGQTLPSDLSGSIKHRERTLSQLPLAPAEALLSRLLIHNEAQRQKTFATTTFDCGVCFMSLPGSECVQLWDCDHIYCRACLAQFCKVQIAEGNVRGVTCPQPGCAVSLIPSQVKMLVGDVMFNRYDRLLLQSTLDTMGDVVYCPRRTCGSAVILEEASRAAMCSVCSYAFCVSCRKIYHGVEDCQAKKTMKKQKEEEEEEEEEGDTPQDFRYVPETQEGMQALWDDYASGSKLRRRLLESRYGQYQLRTAMVENLSEEWVMSHSKYCPHCYLRIQKDGGCNVMTCAFCRQCFCWVCLTRLTVGMRGHFEENSLCSLD